MTWEQMLQQGCCPECGGETVWKAHWRATSSHCTRCKFVRDGSPKRYRPVDEEKYAEKRKEAK